MLPKSVPLSLVIILSLFLLSPLSAIGEYTIKGVFDSSSPTTRCFDNQNVAGFDFELGDGAVFG